MVDLSRDQAGRTRARLLDLVSGRFGKVYADRLHDHGDAFRQRVQVATLDPFHGDKNAIDDQLADAASVLEAFTSSSSAAKSSTKSAVGSSRRSTAHRGRKDDPLYEIGNLLRCAEERLIERSRLA